MPPDPRPIATLIFLLAIGFAACSKHAPPGPSTKPDANAFERLELRYQGSAGNVTFPELAEDLGYLAPIKLKFIGITISGPQDIQTVVTGDSDFGGAFNGAVIKLIAAGAQIRPVIGYYGVDDQTWSGFFVLEDSPIHSARDLIGKKISVNTLGAHQEFAIREYLARNGLNKDEIAQVTLVVVPPVSSEQALRQKQVDVSTLGSILRDKALERGGLRSLFSDYELFGKFTAGTYVLTTGFLHENPRTARRFVEATAKAIEWARAAPREQVIARFTSIIQHRTRNEDASAIRYWHSTGIAHEGGLIDDREFQVWIDWLVKDGQLSRGQLQARDIFTNDLNPFQKPSPSPKSPT